MIDNYKHKGLRLELIKVLRQKGITDEAILAVMGQIPRQNYVDRAFEHQVYKDQAFPIACEQTISQPYTVAFQTQLLDVKKNQRILEIGTGSGYQASVLMLLGARVYTVERHEHLHKKTTSLLESLGYGAIRTFYGDGMLGLPKRAPFDRILVTAGAANIPNTLLSQLKIGGIAVIPVGGKDQIMYRITRVSETKFDRSTFGDCKFVPLLAGKT